MNKVRIFWSSSEKDLEEKINKYLENIIYDYKLKDIKYQMIVDSEDIINLTAMVILE